MSNLVQRVGNIVTVKLFDRMLDRQTRQLSLLLQQSIEAAGGKIRLFLFIDSKGPGAGPEALFENLHFVKLHADHIERMAIIGSQAWDRTYVGLFGLFAGIEMQFFDRSQTAEAIQWLHADRPALK
jgi:hypothetical protein